MALSLGLAACGEADAPPHRDWGAVTEPAAGRRVATAPANGWGDDIAWRSFSEGIAEAKRERMPLMLVVHTQWCGKCKALKSSSFRDAALRSLSDRFVMVNVDQDAEPAALEYAPDGTYIPRVMFLDPDGRLDPKLQNSRPSRFRYFYMPHDDLVSTMRTALERHAGDS